MHFISEKTADFVNGVCKGLRSVKCGECEGTKGTRNKVIIWRRSAKCEIVMKNKLQLVLNNLSGNE